MSQNRGKKGLMVLVALVPFVVISIIIINGRGAATNRGASNRTVREESDSVLAVNGEDRQGERRLQSSTYDFATQLEMTVCLTEDHTVDSATISSDQFKTAVMAALSIDNGDLVKVDDTLTRCEVDEWQLRVSVYNEADEENGQTAADIASEQVDKIYIDPGTTAFFEDVVTELQAQDSELDPVASDFDLQSLGFLVIWLDSSGDVLASQGTTKDNDVVSIGGTDVWWPWWAWLIYAGVVLCCICPMLFFFFKWRRDKEAEEEGFGVGSVPGKELGTPAPPSATSTNPYGGNYPTGEEYKNGQ